MVFLGLNIAESRSTRGSGTSTTAVCTSILPVAGAGRLGAAGQGVEQGGFPGLGETDDSEAHSRWIP